MTIHRAFLITLALAFFAIPSHALAANCADCDDGGGGGGPGGTPSHAGPPDTSIYGWSGGSIYTDDNTPSFGFTADEPATFFCRVDNGGWSGCGSPKTLATLADGQHTFYVKALDTDANYDPSPDSRTFTVDTVNPNVTITGGPPPGGLEDDPSPTYTFGVQEANLESVKCRVDNGSWSSCSSPWTTPTMSDGTHTVSVQAKDKADHTDTDSRTVVIDKTAPVVQIDKWPGAYTGNDNPVFEFSAPYDNHGDYKFVCQIDNNFPDYCNGGSHSSSFQPAHLTDGPHTFRVEAVDAAGNWSSPWVEKSFTVDTVMPQIDITGGPKAQRTKDTTPAFDFTVSDATPVTIQCAIENAPFAPCSSPKTIGPLSDGQHSFIVKATDAAGHTTTETTYTIVDTTAPVTTIDDGPSGPTNDDTPEFKFSAPGDNGPAYTFACTIDNGPAVPCSGGGFTSGQLTDGPHVFGVKGTDGVGNEAAAFTTRSFKVDTVAPALAIVNGPADGSTILDTDKPVFGMQSEAGAQFKCAYDNGQLFACGSPIQTSPWAVGTHTFHVRAYDEAGNASPWAQRTFMVEAAPVQAQPHQQQQPQAGQQGETGATGAEGATGKDGTTTVVTVAASQVAKAKLPACRVTKAKKHKRAKAKRGKRARAAAVTCGAKKKAKKEAKRARRRTKRH